MYTAAYFLPLIYVAYSTVKMEAVHCSETSINFYRATQRQVSLDVLGSNTGRDNAYPG
jgi:hypothetical protein